MRESERSAALRRRSAQHAPDAAEPGVEQAQHPLVALQRQVGNAQVARMLAQREGDEEELQAKHDPIQREGDEEELQAKHDPIQREGDGVGTEHLPSAQAKHDPIQREGDGVGTEHLPSAQAKHDPIQREGEAAPRAEVGMEGGPLSSDLSSRISSRRGAGASLDSGTRASMEQSFGTSFADVRIHTDGESDALNRSISAKAFTTGNDVFFRKDASPSDQSLLAHELTHVVQQRGASGSGGGMSVGAAGDAHEHEADQVSQAVTSGSAAQAQREADQAQVARAAAVQREGAEEEEEMG
jgi:Domain of unknown function (DUF4157)